MWLWNLEKLHGLPAISAERFHMNGKALCLMNVDMFVQRVPLGNVSAGFIRDSFFWDSSGTTDISRSLGWEVGEGKLLDYPLKYSTETLPCQR